MKEISKPYCWAVAGYVLLLSGIVAFANLGTAEWVFTVASLIPYGDKVGHTVLMGLLAFFLNGALCCRTLAIGRGHLLVGSMIAYLLVFAEELSQIWMASRSFDVYDLLFDVIGIFLFGRLALWNARLKRKPLMAVDRPEAGNV